ncbi:hypothetical protein HYX58_03365 [Candidatus Dependentiae bacterium]|nr:hypothetical protein [Candidatus Dependentiae bacterium]
MTKKITLVCSPLRFYTTNDEDLFFNWLKKINCIEDYKGVGNALHVHIISNKIEDSELIELFGIFNRYKFDEKQLVVFKNENNKDWF